MGVLKIKQSLKSQAKMQTLEQVGVYRSGDTKNFGYVGDAATQRAEGTYVQDGFIIYDYFPLPGGTDQLNDNYLITNVLNEFVKARAANTSIAKYSSVDVAKWLVAAGGLNCLNAEIIRAFKSLSLGKNAGQQERMAGLQIIPTQVLAGNMNTIQTNIADKIAYYNRIISKLSGIKIPKGVPFIDYWYKLSSTVWREDMTDKSQRFMLRAKFIPYWDVNGTDGPVGSVGWFKTTSNSTVDADVDLDWMLYVLNTLADVYTTDDDVNNMFAEFEKANMSDVYSFKPLTDSDVLTGLEYQFSVDMIQAIKNARIVPVHYKDMAHLRLIETTNLFGNLSLVYRNTDLDTNNEFEFTAYSIHPDAIIDVCDWTSTGGYADRILGVHKDDASEDEVFDAVQFSPVIKRATSGASGVYCVKSAGLAIITGMQIYTSTTNNAYVKSGLYVNSNYYRGRTSQVSVITVFNYIMQIGLHVGNNAAYDLFQFTAIPTFYLIGYSSSNSAETRIIIDDCDNTMVKNVAEYQKIHNAICMSEVSYDKRRD